VAKVVAVCRSKRRGVRKEPISRGLFVENYGLVGDAHASSETQRQVSLLARESTDKKRNLVSGASPGDNAENLTTEGIDWPSLPLGTKVSIGQEVILEITEIGKKEHPSGYAILPEGGISILPGEGVFAKVIRGGEVKPGDKIEIRSGNPLPWIDK